MLLSHANFFENIKYSVIAITETIYLRSSLTNCNGKEQSLLGSH